MRFIQSVEALRDRVDRRVFLGIGLVLFVAAFVYALTALPPIPNLRWIFLLLVAVIAIPITVLFNAAEFTVSLALLGGRANFRESMRVALMASAANLLPLPGAALVRIGAMKRRGIALGGAFRLTIGVGLVWIGTAVVLLGLFLLTSDAVVVALAILAGGSLLTFVAARVVARTSLVERPYPLIAQVVAVELGSTGIKALRLWLVLHALHQPATASDALALTVASIVATSSGFFPGGLGLSEALSGIVAPAVGLPLAVGVLASGIDRVIGIVVLGLSLLPLMINRRAEDPPTMSEP
jgi:hypothetical protein